MRLQRLLFSSACLTAITFGLLSHSNPAATLGGPCAAMGSADRARLLEYVRKKYKLPKGAPLAVSGESFVGSTCFRKLQFKSTDPKRNFQAELFASPDLRFLTHELLDSNVDPIVEEQRKQQALATGLTAGSFPSRGPKDAKVVITIFSDFQCPYCARMAAMLNKEVLAGRTEDHAASFPAFSAQHAQLGASGCPGNRVRARAGRRLFLETTRLSFRAPKGVYRR
jgi:hypothetical protein